MFISTKWLTNKIVKNAILLVLASFLYPHNTYAYLDPGAGSYVFQIILAFVIGGLYSLKLYWVRVKVVIKSVFSKEAKK